MSACRKLDQLEALFMIDITVKVPSDRIAEFYSMYGQWLARPAGPLDEQDEVPAAWGPADVDLAKVVWEKLSETAQALFSTLIDNPGKRYSGDELADLIGLANGKHSIAGVLGWPGKHCYAAGREWLWHWDYAQGEHARYWMTEQVADLFRQVRTS